MFAIFPTPVWAQKERMKSSSIIQPPYQQPPRQILFRVKTLWEASIFISSMWFINKTSITERVKIAILR